VRRFLLLKCPHGSEVNRALIFCVSYVRHHHDDICAELILVGPTVAELLIVPQHRAIYVRLLTWNSLSMWDKCSPIQLLD
jgi:hypothetical protein